MHASLTRCHALELEALLSVARRCRAVDRRELAAAFIDGPDGPERNAEALMASTTIGATIHDKAGIPQAALGVLPTALPGHYGAWLVATDDWPLVWRTAVRWVRSILVPSLLELGARRCTAACPVENATARRFIEGLGMEHEGVMRKFGADGGDWAFFAGVR